MLTYWLLTKEFHLLAYSFSQLVYAITLLLMYTCLMKEDKGLFSLQKFISSDNTPTRYVLAEHM